MITHLKRCLGLAATWASVAACQDSAAPKPFTPTLDIAVCDPAAGPFSSSISNSYFPAAIGTQWTLEGTEGGKAVVLEISALDSTEDVAGVTTRVLRERETHDGNLVEISYNFLAQAQDGTVCYYGESVDIYRGGVVVGHEGEWRAGVGGALPGILVPAAPAAGQAFQQEVATGVAEDRVEIVAEDETVTVPYGTYTATVRYRETSPLEPGSRSTKVYADGIGPLVDDRVRLTAVSP